MDGTQPRRAVSQKYGEAAEVAGGKRKQRRYGRTPKSIRG